MKKYKKLSISLVAVVLLVGGISLGLYLKSVSDYKQAVREAVISEPDISAVPDGVYTGEYDVDFIYAKVEVTVLSGKITTIDILEHRNGRGEPAESIVDEILIEQKIDVDSISGATNSSIVIKKAIENALSNG